MPMEHFYTFYSLKLGKSTWRGNGNWLMICTYLYIHVSLLQVPPSRPFENMSPWPFFRSFTVYISVTYIPKITHSEK